MTITDTEVIRVADFAPAVPTLFTPVMMVTPHLDKPALLADERGLIDQPVTSDTAERNAVHLDTEHRATADAPNVPPHVAARRRLTDGVIDGGFGHSR